MTHPKPRTSRSALHIIGRRLALILALACAAPRSAAAWDPSTTHLGMIDRAVQASAVHLRWMAGSELQRGLFTPLRVDPALLSPAERRFLSEALKRSHGGSGVQPLGGPGACPGPKAPPATQLYCVDGDSWEMPAVQWIHLGAIAELVPSARAVHHFVDRRDATSASFDDPQQRPLLLRARQFRSNGAPLAGYVTGTSFAGTGPSAIAWLADKADPLAPPQTFRHLELASTLPDARGRDHHMAMALVGLGSLLHVLQDMSVPAHARGDVTAFFAALSAAAGDRGLPFSEIARLSFRRHDLPSAPPVGARGTAFTPGLRGHFLGDADYEGLAVFTGRRFLSERSVPPPQFIDHGLAPDIAAARLLADAELDPAETKGAVLTPWPGARGYLKTATGRPLAAFDTDADGMVRCYIDEAVYREQFAQLIPRAVDASRSLIDWFWPAWPELTYDAVAGHVDLAVDASLQDPEVLVFTQDAAGLRTIRAKYRVTAGQRGRVAGLAQPTAELRNVVVLRARRSTGEPLLIEHVLGAETKVYPVITGPDLAPPPPATPAPPETLEAPPETPPAEAPPAEPAEVPAAETSPDDALTSPASEPAPKGSLAPSLKAPEPLRFPSSEPGAKPKDAGAKPVRKTAADDAKPNKPAADAKPTEPAPKTSNPGKPPTTAKPDQKASKPADPAKQPNNPPAAVKPASKPPGEPDQKASKPPADPKPPAASKPAP